MLSIAKTNREIDEITQPKPQETLEYKMDKQKESFPFDVSLYLNEKWMMGVTSVKVQDTVYSITPFNNKFEILLTKQQLKELGIDTELAPIVASLNEISDNKFLEKNLIK